MSHIDKTTGEVHYGYPKPEFTWDWISHTFFGGEFLVVWGLLGLMACIKWWGRWWNPVWLLCHLLYVGARNLVLLVVLAVLLALNGMPTSRFKKRQGGSR